MIIRLFQKNHRRIHVAGVFVLQAIPHFRGDHAMIIQKIIANVHNFF
jgi:hypothetical protein